MKDIIMLRFLRVLKNLNSYLDFSSTFALGKHD